MIATSKVIAARTLVEYNDIGDSDEAVSVVEQDRWDTGAQHGRETCVF